MSVEPTAIGRCWECGYPLRGLESRRCPECGRPFDPGDPTTMNMGQEVGWLVAWLMRPPGVGIYVLTGVSVVMSLWGTATPGPDGEYAHFVLSRLFSPMLRSQFFENEVTYTEHTGRFVLAAIAWALVLGLWALRRVARGITVRRLSKQKPATFAYWRRWLVTPVVFGLTLIVCRTWAPVYLGFWVSKWEMEREPASATTQPANLLDRWLGVYPPPSYSTQTAVYRGPGNLVWVHVRWSGGFVRSGDHPPGPETVPGYGPAGPWRYRAMGGGWYAFYHGE